jgi:hypothetical protein
VPMAPRPKQVASSPIQGACYLEEGQCRRHECEGVASTQVRTSYFCFAPPTRIAVPAREDRAVSRHINRAWRIEDFRRRVFKPAR